MGYPMDPYYEVKLLRRKVEELTAEVEELRRENSDLLMQSISASERSTNNMVRALLSGADPEKMEKMRHG